MEANSFAQNDDEQLETTDVVLEASIVQKKRSRKRNITIFVGVTILNVALIALLWTQLITPSQQAATTSSASAAVVGEFNSPLIGKQAPDLTVAALDGSSGGAHKVPISRFKGSPIVINFWASWCQPCNDEAPFLQKNVPMLQSQGVKFISIDAPESQSIAEAFAKKYNLSYPSVQDNLTGATSIDYGVTTFPMTVFINRRGIIKAMWNVQLNDAGLKLELSKITS